MGSLSIDNDELGVNDVMTIVNHLLPGSSDNRRYVTAGGALSTGKYGSYDVVVRDVRPMKEEYTLETKGFELASCPTQCEDLWDMATIERDYFPELVAHIKKRTGADIVFCHMPRLRQSGKDPNNRDVQPVAGDVHVDVNEDTARNLAGKWLHDQGMGDLKYSRLLFLSNWRVLSDPPQDYPLGLLDPDTLSDEDGVYNYLIACPTIPSAPYPPIPPPGPLEEGLVDARQIATEERLIGAGYAFHHKPSYRWVYYADMTTDELLSFKLCDTDHSSPWRVPHTAFLNDRPGTVPRRSLEVRTYCIFK
ncbi:hypothetical protein H2200_000329 [Cladophialophora chaetospira]|uniref:Uncharacterized protein n=1 Tax=Cladophialophora chaetospira TaxID=386627 RepID=A0AA38XN80_9EURO|nr:hypothetical protein H2200_000329 [Cladophialophora chaetospira]